MAGGGPGSLSAVVFSPALRVLLHCLLGAYVASGCQWGILGREISALLLATALLAPGISLRIRRPRVAVILVTLAVLLALRENRIFLVVALLGALTALGAEVLRRRHPRLSAAHRCTWASLHACLPLLAGFAAVGSRPGSSALLLALGFLCVHVGAFPLLGPSSSAEPEAEPGTREWTGQALREGAATTMMVIGLACLVVWLWTYGAGLSGLALMAPGGLGLLWLGTGWTLVRSDPHERIQWRHQAALAWILVLLAIGTASFL